MLLLAPFAFVETVSCQPLKPLVSLFYPRSNGRIGDIAVLPSGQLLFTNYPTRPGRIWAVDKDREVMVYEFYPATQYCYGVAVSPAGEIYFSVSSTGEVFRLFQNGDSTYQIIVFKRSVKNAGPIAFSPNGTLFIAEMIASEGSQSVYKLVPDAAGYLTRSWL